MMGTLLRTDLLESVTKAEAEVRQKLREYFDCELRKLGDAKLLAEAIPATQLSEETRANIDFTLKFLVYSELVDAMENYADELILRIDEAAKCA